MNEETPPDLSLVTTIELIEELKRRSRALVVGIDPLADRSVFTVLRYGNKLMVSGLIRSLMLDADYDLNHDPRNERPAPSE